uniref:C2 DOCK-type domain-containing protein n=1 Tax=Parascaris equorum TaxID=6256 RepID=A0A914R8I4_PAREQ
MLVESRKGGSKLARLKTFPAKFKLEISGNGIEECPMRLTPELLRVHPYVPGNSSDIVKEIAEFPTKGVYAVNACYRNLLYVYPRFANLSNRSGASRNISLRVELMDAHERPMQLVFGKSSCPDIALPVDLNDGHHLLFTFYHITCKQNKVGDEVETPIGYSLNGHGLFGYNVSRSLGAYLSLDRVESGFSFYFTENIFLLIDSLIFSL